MITICLMTPHVFVLVTQWSGLHVALMFIMWISSVLAASGAAIDGNNTSHSCIDWSLDHSDATYVTLSESWIGSYRQIPSGSL